MNYQKAQPLFVILLRYTSYKSNSLFKNRVRKLKSNGARYYDIALFVSRSIYDDLKSFKSGGD